MIFMELKAWHYSIKLSDQLKICDGFYPGLPHRAFYG